MSQPLPAFSFADSARSLLNLPVLRPLKHSLRNFQTLFNYADFQHIKQLADTLPLADLLERQPRFAYKYLSAYSVASFSRSARLAALLNHYRFLAAVMQRSFFQRLHDCPVLWCTQAEGHEFSITLSYPQLAGFECELSLNFLVDKLPVQVVGFVVVPGHLVGAAGEQALLFSQVQGSRQPALLRHATKTLHDITPAALLVNAAYGLAEALGIQHAAGVSTEEQVHSELGKYFDYNIFWQEFRGVRTAQNLYLLAIPAPERPLLEIRRNHRARTLRKRVYKRELRSAIAHYCQAEFLQ